MRISSLLFTCALALSAIAAYYSIIGLATIFSGAYTAVILMAAMLEVSKLVIASWLYQKWDQVSGLLRAYLTASVVVLMLITSLGIFGFLSKAHVEQNLHNTSLSMRIEQIDGQLAASAVVINRYRVQLEQLDRSINIQLDNNRAAQALAARQRQNAEREQIRQRLDAEQQRQLELQEQRLALRQQMSMLESEVGPIRYVAEIFVSGQNIDLEQAVRWMIIALVLVFDPLAVLMLIAANMSLHRERRNDEIPPLVTQPDAIPDVPVRPLGDVLCVDGRPMRWWSGTAWERFDDPPLDYGLMLDRLKETVSLSIGEVQKNAMSGEQIAETVRLTMDQWLTDASLQPQSVDTSNEPDSSDQSEQQIEGSQEPDVLIQVPVGSSADVYPTSVTITVDPPKTSDKPSWL